MTLGTARAGDRAATLLNRSGYRPRQHLFARSLHQLYRRILRPERPLMRRTRNCASGTIPLPDAQLRHPFNRPAPGLGRDGLLESRDREPCPPPIAPEPRQRHPQRVAEPIEPAVPGPVQLSAAPGRTTGEPRRASPAPRAGRALLPHELMPKPACSVRPSELRHRAA